MRFCFFETCAMSTPKFTKLSAAIALGLALIAQNGYARTEIKLAHQLEGHQAKELEQLIQRFNQQQTDVEVRPIKQPAAAKPAILNLSTRADLIKYLSNAKSYVSVEKLLADNNHSFNPKDMSEALRATVTVNNQVQALPVAFTTPLLFWNKDKFRDAGLDSGKAPKTWEELQDMAGKLVNNNMQCAYTTSWPVWVHIDNLSAWAGAPTVSGNKLAFNGLIQVRHLARLTSWAKTNYYTHYGLNNEADARFINGECGIITTNADIVSELQANKKFDFGVAPLPVIDDNSGAPFNSLAGGAALWVSQGYSADQLKAAAKFLAYTLTPDTQLTIARQGGYMPLTPAAQVGAQGWLLRGDAAAQDMALDNVNKSPAQGAGIGWISFNPQLRSIVGNEMAAALSGKKSAKAALDTAVSKGQSVYRPLPIRR